MCMILVGRHVSGPCTRGLDAVTDIQSGEYGEKRGTLVEEMMVRSKTICSRSVAVDGSSGAVVTAND